MRMNKILLSMFLVGFLSGNVLAEEEFQPEPTDGQVVYEDGQFVWDGIVAFTCIEQNELYAKTWYGRLVSEGDDYTEWKAAQSPKTLQCLKEKQFIPARLCGELFTINKNTSEDFINKLYIKHKKTIDGMRVLNECDKNAPVVSK